MAGRVISINISNSKGKSKSPVNEAIVIENWGIKGDAHGGSHWHRQISLLAVESMEKMRNNGLRLSYGDFAENITTEGINLSEIELGEHLKIGEVIIEITQHGKRCHGKCNVFKTIGDCIMPKEGVFARVIKGGLIKVGDEIEIL